MHFIKGFTMSKSLTIIWQYPRAFVLIYACLYGGILSPGCCLSLIPGSIIGMLILFKGWRCKLCRRKWVNPASNILIRYMALLFVPIGARVM